MPIQVPETDDYSLSIPTNPTLHTYLPSESTIVAADVHHNTVFDVFDIRCVSKPVQLIMRFSYEASSLYFQYNGLTFSVDHYVTSHKQRPRLTTPVGSCPRRTLMSRSPSTVEQFPRE